VRARLLAWLAAGLAIVLVPTGLLSYMKAREEVDALLDYQLRETALSLKRQSVLVVAIAGEIGGAEEGEVVVQILDDASGLAYVSRSDRQLPLLPLEGFHDLRWQGRDWRVYTLRASGRTVQVGQPMSVRARMSADAALRHMVPFIAMVPIAGVIVWSGIGFGLRPLDRVASALRRRRPDALDPLPADDLPQEVRPLAEALNELLGRLDHAFAAQRQFVGDAAHELRTPLTALQLQLQNLERAPDEAGRAAATEALRAGLRRASRLVEQLLAMARLDPEAPRSEAPVDLLTLVRSVLAEAAPLADAKDVDLGLAFAAEATVPGEQEALRLMLRNLVDNAVRYTPPGGRVDVSLRVAGGAAQIEVADTGPGIPADERERVFDRFYRLPGGDAQGSGLGLAIARRVVQRHGGSIALDEGEGGKGLRVTVGLPGAGTPAGRSA
jgi:two-component system OmpR family sensor kinase